MEGPLLPPQKHVPQVSSEAEATPSDRVLATRDHRVIRRWAARRNAEPATGQETPTGAATVDVKDGGAGIRFNFPGFARFRPISWEEWFDNFDRHQLAFVFDNDAAGGDDGPPSSRYRIVKAEEWKGLIG